MSINRRAPYFALTIIIILTAYGCASYAPRPIEDVPFLERSQTQENDNLRVTAAVPSAIETRQIFSVDLYGDGIQPVWLEIENNDKKPVWFLPVGLDSRYFTPLEAAYLNHFRFSLAARRKNLKMDRYFFERGKDEYIGPGNTRSGFVFTNLDEGTKEFNVDLVTEDRAVKTFTFFISVPGLRADHHKIDFEALYSADEIVFYDEDGLRKALESLPCCTTNKNGTEQGDPLNLVVIGDEKDMFHAFIRAGWDETETIHTVSAWKTGVSFLFGGRYRYSPVSPLYVYGRSQDVALQKARETIHERNHLRLWLSPLRLEGKPVWVGQISRDIGVRFTWKTIVTHKIDSDVDETRDFLIQDLWYSQALEKFAFAKGVGAAPMSEPRGNLTGDPYFTDGYRVVLWVSSQPIDFKGVEFVKWEIPPQL
jgi:hypothetical protein